MSKKLPKAHVAREKSALVLRFDEDLHGKVKALAETAQISVNQLIQGLARWAVQNAQCG